jgi:hypothetical protein
MSINPDAQITIGAPRSILWAELKSYSFAIDQQDERIKAITKEMYGNWADTNWLDYWMDSYFGKPRIAGESDADYFARAKYEILSHRCNNAAMARLVKHALGIDVTIVDAYPTAVTPQEKRDRTGRFFLSMVLAANTTAQGLLDIRTKVSGVIERVRAAGTEFILQSLSLTPSVSNDTATVVESYTLKTTVNVGEAITDGLIFFGAKWKFGKDDTHGHELHFKMNPGIHEQAQVTVKNSSDGSTASYASYGG